MKSLKSAELIDEFEMGSEMDELTQNKIIYLANAASPFFEDTESGKICYIINDEKYSLDVVEDEFLQKKNVEILLPEITFDVVQNGIVEKPR